MIKDDQKNYIRSHAKNYLTVDESGKGFICPICGSGKGKHGTGITTKDGIHFTCWAGCFTNSDIIDIIGIEYSITDSKEKFDKAFEKFGLTTGNKEYRTEKDFYLRTKIKKNEKVDYTDFYNGAHKNLHKTNYLISRGIRNKALADRFNLGFAEEWRHSKAPDFVLATPRLIIPTSRYSYLARDTRSSIPEKEKRFAKQKEGKICSFFNIDILDSYKYPVFLVEGEIDALSVIEVGGEAIALGSIAYINKFLDTIKTKKSNKFIIVPDNDENKTGQKGAEKLKKGLEQIGYSCKLIELPKTEKTQKCKDVNDVLLADRQALELMVSDEISKYKEEQEIEKNLYMKTTSVLFNLQNFLDNIAYNVNTPCISTGFNKLDYALEGGLYEGLYIIGAISSLGKTTLVMQIADQIARMNEDILFFSLEMSIFELMAKSISRNTLDITRRNGGNTYNAKTTRGITTGKRYKNYSNEERTLIDNAIREYREYAKNIYIAEGIGDIGVSDIRKKIEKHCLITGKKPVVVIDYIQILAPFYERGTDKQNIDKSVLELKRISRDFKIPVIGISSFNRSNYKEAATMEAFKESGAIEYSSDVLIGLQFEGAGERNFDINEAKKKDPRDVELVILKNRNGPMGLKILYTYYPLFNYFEEK